MHTEVVMSLHAMGRDLLPALIRYLRPMYIPDQWGLQESVVAIWRRSMAEQIPDAHFEFIRSRPELRWDNANWWAIGADLWLTQHGVRFSQELDAIRRRAFFLKKHHEGQITSREAVRESYLEWLDFALLHFPDPPAGWVRCGRDYICINENQEGPHREGA